MVTQPRASMLLLCLLFSSVPPGGGRGLACKVTVSCVSRGNWLIWTGKQTLYFAQAEKQKRRGGGEEGRRGRDKKEKEREKREKKDECASARHTKHTQTKTLHAVAQWIYGAPQLKTWISTVKLRGHQFQVGSLAERQASFLSCVISSRR